MNLETFKFGLGIAAVVLMGIVAFFALYWKIGEAALQRSRKKQGLY